MGIKFKKGDKVKVLNHSDPVFIGSECTITNFTKAFDSLTTAYYEISFDGVVIDDWAMDNDLELIK